MSAIYKHLESVLQINKSSTPSNKMEISNINREWRRGSDGSLYSIMSMQEDIAYDLFSMNQV